MLHRLAIPLLFMIGPRLVPVVIRYVLLIWRLTFDKRVPLALRLLVPLAVLYILSPVDLIRDAIPVLGRFDDLLVSGMAVLLLVKLSPRHVVDEHLGKRPEADRPQERDPSRVVEGSGRLIDEE